MAASGCIPGMVSLLPNRRCNNAYRLEVDFGGPCRRLDNFHSGDFTVWWIWPDGLWLRRLWHDESSIRRDGRKLGYVWRIYDARDVPYPFECSRTACIGGNCTGSKLKHVKNRCYNSCHLPWLRPTGAERMDNLPLLWKTSTLRTPMCCHNPLGLLIDKLELKNDVSRTDVDSSPPETCPNCRNTIHLSYVWCPVCGKVLKPFPCKYCGQTVEPEANFCLHCGAPHLIRSYP